MFQRLGRLVSRASADNRPAKSTRCVRPRLEVLESRALLSATSSQFVFQLPAIDRVPTLFFGHRAGAVVAPAHAALHMSVVNVPNHTMLAHLNVPHLVSVL